MRTSKSECYNSINFPKNSSSWLNLANRNSKPIFWFSRVGGRILRTILPNVFSGGYKAVFRKSVSLVNNILFSLLAKLNRWEFLKPLSAAEIWWPCVFNQRQSLHFTFSSDKNFMMFFVLKKKSFSFNQLGGIFQRGANVGLFQGWKVLKNFCNSFSIGEHFQDLPDHDTSSFKSRFAVANFRVSNDIFINLNSTHKRRIPLLGSEVKVMRKTCVKGKPIPCRGFLL